MNHQYPYIQLKILMVLIYSIRVKRLFYCYFCLVTQIQSQLSILNLLLIVLFLHIWIHLKKNSKIYVFLKYLYFQCFFYHHFLHFYSNFSFFYSNLLIIIDFPLILINIMNFFSSYFTKKVFL